MNERTIPRWLIEWGMPIRRKESDRYSIAAWFLLVSLLLYIPVNFQRRFIEGWHAPVTILATVGWQNICCSIGSLS